MYDYVKTTAAIQLFFTFALTNDDYREHGTRNRLVLEHIEIVFIFTRTLSIVPE